ncbi:MAG: TfoX/Sxy family protein [Proteobacteria bacterium]|nr:TfoX/Sxy family protein [Pseudomonadota bacterium]
MNDKLLNVGPKSAAWLRQVGIRSREQLIEAGALGAFIKIKRAGFRPGLNLLYALEGAILDCHWRDLPEGRRGELLSAADAAGATAPPARGKPMPPAEPVRTIWSDDESRAHDGGHASHRDSGNDTDHRDDPYANDGFDSHDESSAHGDED